VAARAPLPAAFGPAPRRSRLALGGGRRRRYWNRARCAFGLGKTSLYEATRHYCAWYLLNVAELPDHVVAMQLRHDDGGTLVRELYGHPDAAIARERIRAVFREVAPVVALPVSHEMSHDSAQAAS
jgi:integrase